MKQVTDHFYRIFIAIITLVILIFLLLLIPKPVASAAAVPRDQVYKIKKVRL